MFVLYPMVTAFSYAFFHWQGTTRGGLRRGCSNFVTLFTKAPFRTDLPRALWHNVLFFLGTMLFQNTIGLAIAILLHRRPRTRRAAADALRDAVPRQPDRHRLPLDAAALPDVRAGQPLLTAVGLDSWALPWLGDPDTALWVVILVSVWQWIGFPVLLYGAALGGVPEELSEAARVDGASHRQTFLPDHAARCSCRRSARSAC